MADLLTKVGAVDVGLRSGVVRAEMGDPGIGATVAPAVLDADDLARRMSAARSDMAGASGEIMASGTPTLEARADRLHRLWATVSPQGLQRASGVRGRAAFEVKRTVRRLTAWYVEPRWAGQHEVDAEMARFASDAAAELAVLRQHVAHLEERNDRLQRQVRSLQRERVPER